MPHLFHGTNTHYLYRLVRNNGRTLSMIFGFIINNAYILDFLAVSYCICNVEVKKKKSYILHFVCKVCDSQVLLNL